MKKISVFGLKFSVTFIFLGVLVLSVIALTQSCPPGRESPEYFKLKGEFEVYKAEAEKRADELVLHAGKTKVVNAKLRKDIHKLEISKGLILAESAEINKKIFEQELELKDLQDKESGIQDDMELIFNLRLQVSTLQSNFSLAIKDRDKYKAALKEEEKKSLKLEGIIMLRDETIGVLRPALAAERVARLACEDVIAVGEKDSVWFKIGNLVGKGFKYYGIFAAVRDTVKVAGK